MTLLTVYLVDWIVQSFVLHYSLTRRKFDTIRYHLGWQSGLTQPDTADSGRSLLAPSKDNQTVFLFSHQLAPLIWQSGLGCLVLFIFAIAGHRLVGSFSRRPSPESLD
jgi:hypothetical protein